MCKGKYQTDKQGIMATEQANITEVVVQVAAEAARAVVQAMAVASADNKGNRMSDPN